MGFIEELRKRMKQQEAVAQRVDVERSRLEGIKRQQEDDVRLSEEQIEARIRQERKQAEVFWTQSAFSRLAQDLTAVVRGMKLIERPVRLTPGKDDKFGDEIPFGVSYTYLAGKSSAYLDPAENIAGVSLIWIAGRRRERTVQEHIGWGPEPYKKWEDIYNVIVVECDYQGTMRIVKSRGDISLPLSVWRGNPDIQEGALSKAYENPRVFYNETSDKPYDSPIDAPWNG